MTKRNPVEELLAESMAQLQAAGTFAKAAQPGQPGMPSPDEDDHDLDDDFDDLHAAQKASGADDDDDDDFDSPHGDDDDGEPEGNFSKADGGFVDALPLFEELDNRLESLQAQNAELKSQSASLRGDLNVLLEQVGTLAKAVQAQTAGTTLLAKAIAPNLDAPLPPKTRRGAVVPTMYEQPQADPAQLMAKAEKAVLDKQMGAADLTLLSGCLSSMGVEGARRQLPKIFNLLESM